MSPFFYYVGLFDYWLRFVVLFCLVLAGHLAVNRLIYGRSINGLLFFIGASSVTFTIILDLYHADYIRNGALIHYFLVDAALVVICLCVYKRFVAVVKARCSVDDIARVTENQYSFIVAVLLLQIVVNLLNVNLQGGDSRIAFMGARWYSVVNQLGQLINPAAVFLVFVFLRARRAKAALLLAALVILGSFLAGSKSGFVFAFLGSFLLYRDLFGVTGRDKRLLRRFAPLMIVLALANLIYLQVDGSKVFERIVHYGEATIMVYPAWDPTEACRDNSLLANVHRGFARLAGDESALRFDSLFGFALSRIFYGDTMTGPNARIGAYAYCAFPGWQVIVLVAVVLLYLSLLWFVLLASIQRGGFLLTLIVPLFVIGLVHIVLDYNTAMSYFTLLLTLFLFFSVQSQLAPSSSPAPRQRTNERWTES